jgi:hypothetical protein
MHGTVYESIKKRLGPHKPRIKEMYEFVKHALASDRGFFEKLKR